MSQSSYTVSNQVLDRNKSSLSASEAPSNAQGFQLTFLLFWCQILLCSGFDVGYSWFRRGCWQPCIPRVSSSRHPGIDMNNDNPNRWPKNRVHFMYSKEPITCRWWQVTHYSNLPTAQSLRRAVYWVDGASVGQPHSALCLFVQPQHLLPQLLVYVYFSGA